MTIRTANDNSTILQVNGVDKVAVREDGTVEAEYFKTPGGVLSPVGMFKNKIINGDFNIWSRGPSQSATGYLSVDRFSLYFTGSGVNAGCQRATINLGAAGGISTSAYQLSLNNPGSSSTSCIRFFQAIEDVQTLAGKTATLSFWARSDVPTKQISTSLGQNFGGGSAAVEFIGVKKYNITSTWQKFTSTFEVPSIVGKVLGSLSGHLALTIWGSAGSEYNSLTDSLGHQAVGSVFITGIQLEEGAVATAFEQRPPSIEETLCQRFHERMVVNWYKSDAYSGYFCAFPWHTRKRVLPTMYAIEFVDVQGIGASVTGIGGDRDVVAQIVFASNATYGQAGRYALTVIADAEIQ